MLLMASPTVRVFFFNDTATTEIYTLSLHDALPINPTDANGFETIRVGTSDHSQSNSDRKSTRLNSSHDQTSYAVLCLKKKTLRAHEAGVAKQQRKQENRQENSHEE